MSIQHLDLTKTALLLEMKAGPRLGFVVVFFWSIAFLNPVNTMIYFIKERDSLYKALDDKDDEINKQSQTIERLKNELEDEKQVKIIKSPQNLNYKWN